MFLLNLNVSTDKISSVNFVDKGLGFGVIGRQVNIQCAEIIKWITLTDVLYPKGNLFYSKASVFNLKGNLSYSKDQV